jgi:DNA-binding transcriptional LysR family regulator
VIGWGRKLAGCRLIVDGGSSQKIATLAGAGISINALWSVHREFADGSLVRVLPDYKVNDQATLWLASPKANVLAVMVRLFIDFLLEKLATCRRGARLIETVA